jgi:hypothetical protein
MLRSGILRLVPGCFNFTDAIQLATTKACLSSTKALYDHREKYRDAPVLLVSICTESIIISVSLAQIQRLIERSLGGDGLSDVWDTREDLPAVLDQALAGCMVVFSCLDDELRRVTGTASGEMGWKERVRLLWNEAKLSELLGALRGQQTALNLMLQLLQM